MENLVRTSLAHIVSSGEFEDAISVRRISTGSDFHDKHTAVKAGLSRFTNLDQPRLTYTNVRPFLMFLSGYSRDGVIATGIDVYEKWWISSQLHAAREVHEAPVYCMGPNHHPRHHHPHAIQQDVFLYLLHPHGEQRKTF